MSGGIAFIDGDRPVKEIQKRHYRGRVGDKVKGIVALRVLDIGIGAMGYEQLNDVEVAITSHPLHGRSDEIATEGINFSAMFEVATSGELRIDGYPVKGVMFWSSWSEAPIRPDSMSCQMRLTSPRWVAKKILGC